MHSGRLSVPEAGSAIPASFVEVTQTRTAQFKSTVGYQFSVTTCQFFFQQVFSQFSIDRKFSILICSANKNPTLGYFCKRTKGVRWHL